MHLSNLLFIILALSVLSCAPQNSIVAAKEYSEAKFIDVSLSINLPIEEIVIDDRDAIISDLGETNPESSFWNLFSDNFPKNVKKCSYFNSATVNANSYKSLLFSQQLPVANEKGYSTFTKNQGYYVDLPKEGCKFPDTSKFILFIQNLKVYKSNSSPLAKGGSWMRTIQSRFFVWDNSEGKLVFYGYDTGSMGMSSVFKSAKGEWIDSFQMMAKTVFKGSPFYKKIKSSSW